MSFIDYARAIKTRFDRTYTAWAIKEIIKILEVSKEHAGHCNPKAIRFNMNIVARSLEQAKMPLLADQARLAGAAAMCNYILACQYMNCILKELKQVKV